MNFIESLITAPEPKHQTRILKTFALAALYITVFASLACGGVIPVNWIDWSSGSTQPFVNSMGTVGTVSYTDNFMSVTPGSILSPDPSYPFTNPLNVLDVGQFGNASITFAFNLALADANTILTLGNLRETNLFTISAFDKSGNPLSLLTWSNLGQYYLFPMDTGLNGWDPTTGVVLGIDGGIPNLNSENIFLSLSPNVATIRIDFSDVDGGFEYLDFGLGQRPVPEPSSFSLIAIAALGIMWRSHVGASMHSSRHFRHLSVVRRSHTPK